jgi:hypothetical protein
MLLVPFTIFELFFLHGTHLSKPQTVKAGFLDLGTPSHCCLFHSKHCTAAI